MEEEVKSGDLCACGHLEDPHLLIATNHPLDGGYRLCPEQDCECIGTWSVQGGPRPEPLEEWEKPLMREYLLNRLEEQSAPRTEDSG